MPLINCPDCGKQVSTRADSCPNCGAPVDRGAVVPPEIDAPGGVNKKFAILGGAVLVILLAGGAWYFGASRSQSSGSQVMAAAAPIGNGNTSTPTVGAATPQNLAGIESKRAQERPEDDPEMLDFEVNGYKLNITKKWYLSIGGRPAGSLAALPKSDGADLKQIYYLPVPEGVILLMNWDNGPVGNGVICKLALPAGQVLWSVNAGPQPFGLLYGENLFVTSFDCVGCIDAKTGVYRWKHKGMYSNGYFSFSNMIRLDDSNHITFMSRHVSEWDSPRPTKPIAFVYVEISSGKITGRAGGSEQSNTTADYQQNAQSATNNDQKSKQKNLTIDELSKLVVGKSRQEIFSKLGKPQTIAHGAYGEIWVYMNFTRHPVTNQINVFTKIEFDGNRIAIEVR